MIDGSYTCAFYTYGSGNCTDYNTFDDFSAKGLQILAFVMTLITRTNAVHIDQVHRNNYLPLRNLLPQAFEQSAHAYATFNLPNLSVRLMHMNAPKIYSNGNVGQNDLSLCETGTPFAITTAADLTVCLSNSISLSGSVLQIAPVP